MKQSVKDVYKTDAKYTGVEIPTILRNRRGDITVEASHLEGPMLKSDDLSFKDQLRNYEKIYGSDVLVGKGILSCHCQNIKERFNVWTEFTQLQ